MKFWCTTLGSAFLAWNHGRCLFTRWKRSNKNKTSLSSYLTIRESFSTPFIHSYDNFIVQIALSYSLALYTHIALSKKCGTENNPGTGTPELLILPHHGLQCLYFTFSGKNPISGIKHISIMYNTHPHNTL